MVGVGGQPVGEKPYLLAESLGARVVGVKFEQLIFEDAGAAWFEEDEGQAGIDLRGHPVEDLGEIVAGGVEEAKVVKRTAAADVAGGHLNRETGLGENGFSGGEGLRVVVVVPSVRP